MLEHLLAGLTAFLQSAEIRENQQAKKSKVISLIRSALRDTKKHIEDTRVEDEGDKLSKELAEKWSKAAEAIRPFDIRIAQTFEQKSDYWTNPIGFKKEILARERKFDFLFRLQEVEKTLNELERRWNL